MAARARERIMGPPGAPTDLLDTARGFVLWSDKYD
jgi:hypothetical protein